MDKKKVIELIEQISNTLNWHITATTESDYNAKVKALEKLEEVKTELRKSDWISVGDELPPYGEVVLVVCEIYPNVIWSTKRMDRFENGRTLDEHLFNTKEHLPIITHWRKIDKLEV